MAYMSHGRANAENLLEFMDSQCWPMLEILAIFLGQPMFADVTFGLHFTMQIHRTASFPFSFLPHTEALVRYNLLISAEHT